MTTLNAFLAQEKYEILAFQETWLTTEILSMEFAHNTNYEVFRRDRAEFQNSRYRGGGVLILIHKSLKSQELRSPDLSVAEMQCVIVQSNTRKIIPINAYFTPYGDRVNMLNELEQFIKLARKEHPLAELIVVGDFN